jgi:hypothetical protein
VNQNHERSGGQALGGHSNQLHLHDIIFIAFMAIVAAVIFGFIIAIAINAVK